MRKFSYITVGKILEELEQEGLETFNRIAFYRLEKRLNFPISRRTTGHHRWRQYTRDQANEIKFKIKQEYNQI